MKPIQLKKADQPAADVAVHFKLSEEAQPLLSEGMQAHDFFRALLDNQQYRDALNFMAYLLPKREAIWWGCLCLWEVMRPEPASESAEVIDAVVRWLATPEEELRREIQSSARAAGGAGTSAGSLGLAAFWSEGSMSRPNLPEVKPDPLLTHRMIASAVTAGARLKKPREEQELRFLGLAADVFNGANPLPKKAAKKKR
ncbi:MAG: hypothetical protein AB7K24_07250 [Gemmataceae bacterium]